MLVVVSLIVYLVFGPPDGIASRRIRFVERNPAVIQTYRAIPGSKLGRLLEAPHEACRYGKMSESAH